MLSVVVGAVACSSSPPGITQEVWSLVSPVTPASHACMAWLPSVPVFRQLNPTPSIQSMESREVFSSPKMDTYFGLQNALEHILTGCLLATMVVLTPTMHTIRLISL